MLTALVLMGAGIVAQVMTRTFRDAFFVDKRLERARRAAEETLRR